MVQVHQKLTVVVTELRMAQEVVDAEEEVECLE